DVRIAGQRIGDNQHRVAIGWTFGSGLDANVAVGARLVLDDDLPPQAARQILTDEAGAHVRRAPGPGRHDEANRPVRPFLRLRGRDGDEESQQRDDKAQLHHWKMVPLSLWLIDYPIGPSSVRLAVTPRSRSHHAVLHLSPRAHGLDSAHAIGALCR